MDHPLGACWRVLDHRDIRTALHSIEECSELQGL